MGHHIAHTFFDVQEAVQESTTHYPLVDDLLDWILIQKSVATQAMANRPQSLLQCLAGHSPQTWSMASLALKFGVRLYGQ